MGKAELYTLTSMDERGRTWETAIPRHAIAAVTYRTGGAEPVKDFMILLIGGHQYVPSKGHIVTESDKAAFFEWFTLS